MIQVNIELRPEIYMRELSKKYGFWKLPAFYEKGNVIIYPNHQIYLKKKYTNEDVNTIKELIENDLVKNKELEVESFEK